MPIIDVTYLGRKYYGYLVDGYVVSRDKFFTTPSPLANFDLFSKNLVRSPSLSPSGQYIFTADTSWVHITQGTGEHSLHQVICPLAAIRVNMFVCVFFLSISDSAQRPGLFCWFGKLDRNRLP